MMPILPWKGVRQLTGMPVNASVHQLAQSKMMPEKRYIYALLGRAQGSVLHGVAAIVLMLCLPRACEG